MSPAPPGRRAQTIFKTRESAPNDGCRIIAPLRMREKRHCNPWYATLSTSRSATARLSVITPRRPLSHSTQYLEKRLFPPRVSSAACETSCMPASAHGVCHRFSTFSPVCHRFFTFLFCTVARTWPRRVSGQCTPPIPTQQKKNPFETGASTQRAEWPARHEGKSPHP